MLGLFSFSHPAFGELHGMVENETLWLIGEDVTRALGYKKAQTALQKHVKPEDKKPLEEDDGLKKSKNATIMINESGLYSLCFFCKRSKAKKFKQWMAKEIMPAVRKNLDRLAVLREEKRLSANIGADNIGCFNSDSRNNGERNYEFSNVGSGKCSTAVLSAQETDATADQNLCNACAHNIGSDGHYCEYDCIGVIEMEGDSMVASCEDYEKKGEVRRDKT